MKVLSKLNKLIIKSNVYESPVINKECTEFEVNNWIISKFVIKKLVPIVDVLPFPINEQVLMVAAVCRIKPTHIFEWGTHFGKSARIFFETCKAFNIKAQIHSTDLPVDIDHVEHPGERRGLYVKGIKDVNLHYGDGLEKSLLILSQIKQANIQPLFFVDGDHSYDSVKRELEGIIKYVPQATVLLHDTFYQSEGSGYNTGPHKAIADVLASVPNTYKILSQNLGLPGMTLLWHG